MPFLTSFLNDPLKAVFVLIGVIAAALLGWQQITISALRNDLSLSEFNEQSLTQALNIAAQYNQNLNKTMLSVRKDYQKALEVDKKAHQRNVSMDTNLKTAIDDIKSMLEHEQNPKICDEHYSPDAFDRMQQYYQNTSQSNNSDG